MHKSRVLGVSLAPAAFLLAICAGAVAAGEEGWIELTSRPDWGAWRQPTGAWQVVGDVRPDPDQPRRLTSSAGEGIIVNGKAGRTTNLLTRDQFGDIELRLEFMVPRGSNSGVKLQGLYEVQIQDSWGVERPKASDCGGIYPRAELLPRYHHIDRGCPPRTNASRPPGEWQTLEIVFRVPRFDEKGKKVANARFVKVVLNGQVVQEDVELRTPTGHAWHDREVAEGPILLQADHGPVAFRHVRVRRLPTRPGS